jgi:uncharacterized membrane protein YeiH
MSWIGSSWISFYKRNFSPIGILDATPQRRVPASTMLIYLLQLAGTAVCAISGALAAGRKRLDLVGVVVIGLAAAVGGGTLRDLLLERGSIFWLVDNTYLFVSIGASLLVWVYTRRWAPPHRLLLIVDAAGLSLFTISGIQIAEQLRQIPTVCVVMGVITGVAGGVLRDVLCGEIPMVFRNSELYASAATLGGSAYILLERLGVRSDISTVLGTATIFFLRLAALRLGWRLPVFELK